MRKRLLLIIIAGILTACSPLSLFYKEGAAVSRLNSDLADCKLRGLRDVPVDQDIRYIPGQEVPKTICDANSYCHTVWVQVTPDTIETYDANENLRRDYISACMAKSGYQPVRLPACSDTVVNSTQLSATTVLPPLAENSCAIRLRTGQFQIVTPPN